jgi:hypothetical protein
MTQELAIFPPAMGEPVSAPIDRILQTTAKYFGIDPRSIPAAPARRTGA